MSLLILGHGQHGKDTVAERLHSLYNVKYSGSSWMACDLFIFDMLKEKHKYKTKEQCYEDRGNYRDFWFDAIEAYNTPDGAKLAKAILADNDAYVGMRSNMEFEECQRQGLFTNIWWVDASKRKPLEPKSSFDIPFSQDFTVIDNNGSKDNLLRNINTAFYNMKAQT